MSQSSQNTSLISLDHLLNPPQPKLINPSTLPHPLLDPSTPETALSSLTSLLDRAFRITTPDHRTFIGNLICVDHQCNVILTNAEEFLPPPKDEKDVEARRIWDLYWPKSERYAGEGEGWGGRQVGMITIKGDDCVKIEILEEDGGDVGVIEGVM